MKILQVGACKGNDHVTKLVSGKQVDLLFLIEANPLNIPELTECYANYENCIIKNIGVGLADTTNTLYYSILDGPLYEVSSLRKRHVTYYYPEESIRTFDIECYTLDSIFQKFNIQELDYLFLDIEGIDADVILSFNPLKYKIKNIQIEMLHLGLNQYNVLAHMSNSRYTISDGIDFHGYDKMFTRNDI